MSDANVWPGVSQHGHTSPSDGGTLSIPGLLGPQAANKLYAGPTTGADASPTFRVMVAADVPDLLLTNAKLADATIKNGKLSTATGVTSSGPGATFDFTLNDYSFFPSITNNAVNLMLGTKNAADPGNTVGRFWVNGSGGADASTVRWRYVNASANPVLWVVCGPAGKIIGYWESEDPHGDATPPIKLYHPDALPAVQVAFPDDLLAVPLTEQLTFPDSVPSLGADDAPGDLSQPLAWHKPITICDALAVRLEQHPELQDMPRRCERLQKCFTLRALAEQAGVSTAKYAMDRYTFNGTKLTAKK